LFTTLSIVECSPVAYEAAFLAIHKQSATSWTVCLGVPNGSHLWQVANVPELNGNFEIAYFKATKECLRYKAVGERNFSPTNIIPLVNMSW
jgi:hypothetical protein